MKVELSQVWEVWVKDYKEGVFEAEKQAFNFAKRLISEQNESSIQIIKVKNEDN